MLVIGVPSVSTTGGLLSSAQEIYPTMRSPKLMIKQIEELMKKQTI